VVSVLAMRRLRLLPIPFLVVAAACGSPTAAPHVATLASTAPSTSPSATSQRPQLRLDTGDAERNRLFTAYDDCLVAHGVKINTKRSAVAGGRSLDQSGEPKAAYVACAGKLPQQPPELDEDKNPNYAAQWNDNVKCLRAHGLMVHVTKPGEWTWDSADAVVPDNEEQIEKACELQAFGHGASQ
jgi:hypothetical protein